jgi:hypothetical protein
MSVIIRPAPIKKTLRMPSAIQFPYTDLSDAIAVAEGARKGGGVALTRDQLAAAMNMAPGGGGFATKVATARIFGVIDSSSGKYQLTDLGDEIVDASRHADAKVRAFMAVPLYKRIYDEFRGKLLPPRPHGLERAIVSFGVTEKNAGAARLAFEKSARLAGLYPGGNEDRLVMPFGIGAAAADVPDENNDATASRVVTARGDASGSGGTARGVSVSGRPLEYQLVDLLKTEGVGEQESEAIWTLVRFLSTRGKAE